MKKFIYSVLLSGLALAACTKFAEDSVPALSTPGAPSIELQVVDDNTLNVTVSAAEGTYAYAYAVYEGFGVDKSASALQGGSDKEALKAESIKYDSENASVSFTLTGLKADQDYTVLAVATSKSGLTSDVVKKSIMTSDTEAPELEDYDYQDCIVALYFSETVYPGAGSIVVDYYALNSAEIAQATPLGSVKVALADMEFDGDAVFFEVEGIPAGAYYAINYGEGTFVDACYNKAEALSSLVGLNSQGKVAAMGVAARADKKPFEIGEVNLEDDVVLDWKTPIGIDFGGEYGFGYSYSKTPVVKYLYAGKTIEIDTEMEYADGQIFVKLPEAPVKGAKIDITIPAGSFEDLYGNTNTEWTSRVFFPWTFYDVLGSYQATAINALKGQYASISFEIEPLEGHEGYNILFTKYLGVNVNVPAYFDINKGIITVKSFETVIENYQGYTIKTYSEDLDENEEDKVEFALSAAGRFSNNSSYISLGAFNGNTLAGYLCCYAIIDAERK